MKEHEEEPGLISKLKEYAQIRKDLALMMIADKASHSIASIVSGGILVFLALLIFFFGSMALGFYLSEVIGNTYAGFLIITGFYLLLAILVFVLKEKHIEKPLINKVIKKVFKERNEGIYEKQD